MFDFDVHLSTELAVAGLQVKLVLRFSCVLLD